GGALLVGGLGSVTTVSNCVFANNATTGTGARPGGAIENSPDGDLTVQDCTFQSNTSSNVGGAIDFLSQVEETAGHGNLVVTGSIFISNSSAGNGGAVNVSSVKGSQTITRCLFTGNSTTGGSGGTIAHYNGAMTANYNRFYNNSATIAANGKTL